MAAGLHNAARYVNWRIASLVATLVVVSVILFATAEWLPGIQRSRSWGSVRRRSA